MPAVFGRPTAQPDTEHDICHVVFLLDLGLVRLRARLLHRGNR
jgi:hypothetical protein